MFDWLKKTAQKAAQTATDLGTEYTANQTLIAELLDMPEREMLDALQTKVTAMDSRAYTGFSVVLGVVYMGAKQKVQSLAPEHASPYPTARPAEPPPAGEARQAVIRLRKLEMLSSYGDAYRKGDSPEPPTEALDTPLTRDSLQERANALLAALEKQIEVGPTDQERIDAMNRFSSQTKALQQEIPPGDTFQEMTLLLLNVWQQGLKISRPYLPIEARNYLDGLSDFMADLPTVAANSESPAAKMLADAVVNKHLATLGKMVTRVPLAAHLESNAYAVHLAYYYQEFGQTLLTMLDFEEGQAKIGDAKEHDRLVERFHADSLFFGQEDTTPAKLLDYEQRVLRPYMVEARRFYLRHHLTLIDPPFPSPTVNVSPNNVFYAGGPEVQARLEQVCQICRLNLTEMRAQRNPVYDRWEQLWSSSLAVFDFTGYNPAAADPQTIDPTQETECLSAAGAVATVAYELGWAFVTGTPVVIVAKKGQRIPFDIDLEPVWLEDNDQDNERLYQALLHALYLPQRGSSGSSVAATAAYVQSAYSHHGTSQVRQVAASLQVDSYEHDALGLRLLLEGLTAKMGQTAPLVAIPAFPGGYPTPEDSHLFYVTAFRKWAEAAQEVTRAACARHGIRYQIGYDRIEPDIIRVIWDDLCRASHVVVDITNLNPNAVQELGMAQALGRKTLIITQNAAPHSYFPAVAKIRTHRYDPTNPDSMQELGYLLDRFLSGKE